MTGQYFTDLKIFCACLSFVKQRITHQKLCLCWVLVMSFLVMSPNVWDSATEVQRHIKLTSLSQPQTALQNKNRVHPWPLVSHPFNARVAHAERILLRDCKTQNYNNKTLGEKTPQEFEESFSLLKSTPSSQTLQLLKNRDRSFSGNTTLLHCERAFNGCTLIRMLFPSSRRSSKPPCQEVG